MLVGRGGGRGGRRRRELVHRDEEALRDGGVGHRRRRERHEAPHVRPVERLGRALLHEQLVLPLRQAVRYRVQRARPLDEQRRRRLPLIRHGRGRLLGGRRLDRRRRARRLGRQVERPARVVVLLVVVRHARVPSVALPAVLVRVHLVRDHEVPVFLVVRQRRHVLFALLLPFRSLLLLLLLLFLVVVQGVRRVRRHGDGVDRDEPGRRGRPLRRGGRRRGGDLLLLGGSLDRLRLLGLLRAGRGRRGRRGSGRPRVLPRRELGRPDEELDAARLAPLDRFRALHDLHPERVGRLDDGHEVGGATLVLLLPAAPLGRGVGREAQSLGGGRVLVAGALRWRWRVAGTLHARSDVAGARLGDRRRRGRRFRALGGRGARAAAHRRRDRARRGGFRRLVARDFVLQSERLLLRNQTIFFFKSRTQLKREDHENDRETGSPIK